MQVQQNSVGQTNSATLGTPHAAAPSQQPSIPASGVQSPSGSIAHSLQQALGQSGYQPTSGLYQTLSSLMSFVSSTLNDLHQLLQNLLNPPPLVIESPTPPQPQTTTPGNDPVNQPSNPPATPNSPNTGSGSGEGSGSETGTGGGTGVGAGGGTVGGGGGGSAPVATPPVDTSTPVVDQPESAPRPSLIPTHARAFDRTGEIEWRPRLNDGKLQIIFRPEHLDLAEKVEIYSPDGTTLLATGTKGGKTPDGRPIYNFDRAGGDFPDNAVVVMTFKGNKGVRQMTIPDTSEKYVHGTPAGTGNGGASNGTGSSNGTSSNSGTSQTTSTGSSGGVSTPPPASLIPAHATQFEATGQIEWRPRQNNNKLSIVFRTAHNGMAESVKIYSPDGTKVLATGTYGGKTADGRPIYNFDKTGGDFPANAVVVMTFRNNGGARRMTIPTPADKVVR